MATKENIKTEDKNGLAFIKPYLKPPGVSPREVVSSRILAFTSKMEE